ncbi:Lipoprotein releasing system ATP-binding protein LolD [Chitinispirillum alkaliphilum]|nr:Lipoprotein releasing system ATP-binding protein LolD [Chitinispirillum alkaliphilum]
MSEVMVNIRNLRKQFRDDSGVLDVLKGISLTIQRGEMVALVGVSGSGKTTLLQIVGGLDKATEGWVEVGGEELGTFSPRQLALFRNQKIGFVFQFHHLMPDFTALENVFIPGLINGKSKKECSIRAGELLDVFGLEARRGHYPSELSGGERQRVALARAMFNKPALVLADEPTGNLDRANGELLIELIEKANKELGQTFVIATHDSRLCKGLRRIVYLEDGLISNAQKASTLDG